MDLKDSHFRYHTTLKNDQGIKIDALTLFPGLNEVSFQSRSFQNYSECVKSCKGMMEDLAKDINSGFGEPRFKVGAEVNPIHTGTQTLSKDWGNFEVARFWVYNKAMEGNGVSINAICRGSIFATPKNDSSVQLN